MIPDVIYTGPITTESQTLKKQVCVVHAETRSLDQVIAAAPGGAAAGWMLPPVWQNTITARDEDGNVIVDEDGRPIVETFTSSNPKINKRNMLVWLLVRNIEC